MKLFNSKTQSNEDFKPFEVKQVKIYVCGITPYDTTHLGHVSTYIFFDALIRYLRYKGYEVNYTQNVTDIDDDILKRARLTKKNWIELGDYWTKKFLDDLKRLNLVSPNHYVKATESIDSMIQIIEALIKKGVAYEKNGNVYFNIAKFKNYGQLSHFNEQQMLYVSRERGANPDDPNKINPLDFILWQKSGADEPKWQSLWSEGRPGWHIECSAMIYKYMGDQIDIHGGGRDLVFPHHESEIAQSETFTGKKPFVKYWLHTAMVMYQGEKMSKSLGNLIMVSDLLKDYSPNAIRWLLLSHKYRIPWEYYPEELDEAQKITNHIESVISFDNPVEFDESKLFPEVEEALNNDFDMPKALQILIQKTALLEKETDDNIIQQLKNQIIFAYKIFGFIV